MNDTNIQEAAAVNVAYDHERGPGAAANVQGYWIVRLGFGLIWGMTPH